MNLLGARTVVLVVAATIAMPLSRLDADPLFGEDFEFYPEGSNISGQGGWFGDDIRIGTGSGLGTKVLNGRIQVAPPGYMPSFTVNEFAPAGLSPGHVYVLTFDAYACSWSCGIQGPSHNAGVYFYGATHRDHGLSIGWFFWWYPNAPYPSGWIFDAAGLADDATAWQGMGVAVDRPVTLQVVLDPSIGEAWGVANFGSGTVTTNRFSFAPSRISGLTGVMAHEDFRASDWLGAEFDNILVFEDPTVAITNTTWGGIKTLFH